jgi:Sulfotransferase domain
MKSHVVDRRPSTIAIWATPRSVSTALEKAVSLAPGVRIVHEPFTDCYYFGPERRSSRYGDSPPTAGATGAVVCRALLDRAEPIGLEPSRRGTLVFKDLAFQARPYVTPELLVGCQHAIIMRDPRLVYASLRRLKPDFTDDEFGFDALRDIVRSIESAGGRIGSIVDGTALRAHPAATLRRLCAVHGLAFSLAMLSWTDGRIREWAEHERLSQARWHATLEHSRGFLPPDLDARQVDVAAEHHDVVTRALQVYRSLLRRNEITTGRSTAHAIT